MSEMAYIKVYKDWRESTKRLKDAEKGRLIDALVAYANGEDPEPILSGNEQYSFDGFRAQIDRDRAELEQKRKQHSEAGAKGNAVRWGDRETSHRDKSDRENRKEEKTKDQDQDQDQDNDKEKDEEDKGLPTPPHGGVQRGARFVPPTVDEVSQYCRERQNGIDPQSFVDFYAAKGWMIGKERMRDWHAAVRTWEARRREKQDEQPSKWGNIGQMV